MINYCSAKRHCALVQGARWQRHSQTQGTLPVPRAHEMGALLSKRDGGVPATLKLLLPETGETAVPNEYAISRYAAGLPCSHVTGGGDGSWSPWFCPFSSASASTLWPLDEAWLSQPRSWLSPGPEATWQGYVRLLQGPTLLSVSH